MKNPLKQIAELPFYDLENKICVELGVQHGNWSIELLKCNPKELWLIDCWTQQNLEIYKNDIANVDNNTQEKIYQSVINKFKNNPNVKIIRKFLDDAVMDFSDDYFDFIYLDANHNYDLASNDIKKWWPKLKSDGWLTGHDFQWNHGNEKIPPVKRAVSEFCNSLNLSYIILTRNSWGIKK